MTRANWCLVGAPWDCSGTGRGERLAPDALRAAGLGGLVVADAGDADTAIADVERDPSTGVRALADTVRASGALAALLDHAARAWPDCRPLVVGGDCGILLGVLPWLCRRRGRVGLWFVDAHPDFQDGVASETGETADMDLAILTGHGAAPLVRLTDEPPMVDGDDVVLLGHRTRNLDAAAASELARVPPTIRRIDAETIVRGPRDAGALAAGWLADLGGVWLHLDLDVLDPAVLPAVTYPMPGGPDFAQLALLLEPLARARNLLGISVADFRPDLDESGHGAERVVALLARMTR